MGACASHQKSAASPGKGRLAGGAVSFGQTEYVPPEVADVGDDDCHGLRSTTSTATSFAETPSHATDPVARRASEIVAHLWPRLSAYASHLMVAELQPAILNSLPAALRTSRLKLDKERNHLGSNPLEFRSIRFEQETQDTLDGPIENMVMTTRVEWFADLSVYLGLAGTGVGLNGLSFRGVLVMKLVRMLDHPPFYEGVRMFFNNMPEVDLKFQGAALALNVGFIRRQIVDTITLKLADVIVVPNAFGFPLAPGAEIFRIASPPAQGILELTIVSADNLLPKDTDWFGRGSSDPYVKIACGAYQFQSHTVPKTLSPEFEFSVSVPISDLQRQRVLVELFDEDYLSKDDFLGRISIPVYKLVKSEAAWTRPLLDERGERGSSGTVTARARWHPLSLEVRASHADRPGMVFTGIYAATKLPPVRAGSAGVSYWVAVRCCNMMEGSCQRQRETDRLPGVQADADATPDGSEISEMKAKLDILRRHNLSEADILRVLGVEDCEPPLAQQQMRALSRSDTGLAVELIKSSKNLASVEWNRSFEFPVSRAKSATLSFDLVCQSGGAAPRKLGTYECNMEQVAACPWCTSVRTVPVPGTSAILKLKLQISFFGVGPSGPEASGRFGGA